MPWPGLSPEPAGGQERQRAGGLRHDIHHRLCDQRAAANGPVVPVLRWAHSQGVAARARGLAPVLGADADLLEAAAWLHDIGYAPGLTLTGLHQLDGARYLCDAQHADAMLCRLVAHHSCAIIEAGERGLADVLSLEFEPAPYALSSVLTFCDMTTSPGGELVPVEKRLAEIHDRYGPGHLVSRSIQRATPMILRAVEQVNDRAVRGA